MRSLAFIAVAAFLLAGCASSSTTSTTTTSTTCTGMGAMHLGSQTVMVNITTGNKVTPDTITVYVGDTVKWTWPSSSHGVSSGTCTGGGGGGGYYGYGGGGCAPDNKFSSGVHAGPYEFSFTFTQAGTYPYYCLVHEQMMKGKVEVESP